MAGGWKSDIPRRWTGRRRRPCRRGSHSCSLRQPWPGDCTTVGTQSLMGGEEEAGCWRAKTERLQMRSRRFGFGFGSSQRKEIGHDALGLPSRLGLVLGTAGPRR